jgi:membrane protein implicated in regulation of membrane protease activity
MHGELSVDHDVSGEADHGGIDVHHELDAAFGAGDFWLAFVSLRFLTYFTGIFGIFGIVLTFLTGLGPTSVGLLSLVFALVLGYGGSLLTRYLKVEGETSGVTDGDYIGALGRSLVAIRGSQPGKVRVSIKGDTIDMIALSEGEKDIAMGEEIVVVGLEGDRVRVAPKADYLD